jgi:hypothetical protein
MCIVVCVLLNCCLCIVVCVLFCVVLMIVAQLGAEALAPGGAARHGDAETMWRAERAAIAAFLAAGGPQRIVNVSLHGMTGRGAE